ncbi:MAG: ChaN family lipoprotein [Taibaiella sp.]|nr:ChaN family lipoprotein [Taibaiella sp.]
MKTNWINLITTLCLIFGVQPLWAQSAGYRIIQTSSGDEISYEKMIYLLSKSDIVVMGEEHNDAIAHAAELDVLQGMYRASGGRMSLSMEMWERDVQGVMDEYLWGYISEKNFKKESRAWGNYDDYKPLIDFAREVQVPVVCANTPARYTNMVTRGTLQSITKLPKATRRKYLPALPVDTLKGRYYEKFLEAMGGHTTPGFHLYQSQNLWDATMAHSILEAMGTDPFQKVLHINGRFHSDEYLGVVARLKSHRTPAYKVSTISCIQVAEYIPSEHAGLADFVILTQ